MSLESHVWESRPILTIIVPVYNTKNYLANCINSILQHESDEFELILVDDGSTDGSEVVCDTYAQCDQRVRVYHQSNSGVSSARNYGLDRARGEYVWFCDSDDIVVNGAIELIIEAIHTYAPLIVAFPVEQVDDQGSILGLIPAPSQSLGEHAGPLQRGDFLYLYAHVFRRSLSADIRFNTSLKLLEDRDFLYRVVCKAGDNQAIINKPLYRYLITRSDSAVNSTALVHYVNAISVQEDILRNEVKNKALMPAFSIFADYAIGVLALIARYGTMDYQYDRARNSLIRYRCYVGSLHGLLRIKYLLVLHFPKLFYCAMRLIGRIKGRRGLGSSVVVR